MRRKCAAPRLQLPYGIGGPFVLRRTKHALEYSGYAGVLTVPRMPTQAAQEKERAEEKVKEEKRLAEEVRTEYPALLTRGTRRVPCLNDSALSTRISDYCCVGR